MTLELWSGKTLNAQMSCCGNLRGTAQGDADDRGLACEALEGFESLSTTLSTPLIGYFEEKPAASGHLGLKNQLQLKRGQQQ